MEQAPDPRSSLTAFLVREIIITDAISEAEEIMRKSEKNYPAK